MVEFSKSYYSHKRLRFRKRDDVLPGKVVDLANLAATTLVFGQLLSENPFNSLGFVIGLVILVFVYSSMWYYISRLD